MRALAFVVGFTVIAGACGVTDPPDGFPVAWMVTSCSPVDGPAVDLYLGEVEPTDVSQPTFPHIRISVDAGAEELAGNSFSTQGVAPQIFVTQTCTDEGECVSATGAAVEFENNAGSTIEYSGTVYVTFSDGSSVRGRFEAYLHASLILCG